MNVDDDQHHDSTQKNVTNARICGAIIVTKPFIVVTKLAIIAIKIKTTCDHHVHVIFELDPSLLVCYMLVFPCAQ